MSAGLHPARENLHIPNLGGAQGYLQDGGHMGLPKPISLSPRTFGMDDFGPMGTFKTGLTPRVFSTGLTPRSGFTPRFATGFTPRIGGADTNSFFNRNTGFSPRQNDMLSKMPTTGFTPKDASGMKVPMRFPGAYGTTPSKMGCPEPQQMAPQMDQQKAMHQQQMQHMQQQPDMGGMAMPMFDYMNRPTIPQQPVVSKTLKNTSPSSDDQLVDHDDLDERRRMKNRERVRKCRKRKQDRLNFLEERTTELEKENGVLRQKLSRKEVGPKSEPLTEEQVNEMRKKQNTTLAAYVQTYNESAGQSVEDGARSVWADNAEIIYGHNGTSVQGLPAIVANKTAIAAVFGQYKIRNYTVQWKDGAQDKCVVSWDVEVGVNQNAPNGVPLTAPFADLARFLPPTRTLAVQMVSHLTFEDGKIVEEVRQPNLPLLADALLAEFAHDPAVVADILRCLLKA